MEDVLKELAGHVALAAELVCVACIAIGATLTVFRTALALVRRQTALRRVRRALFTGFASWIILALEFALGADIVRTAIAPTWDDIGQLAAIAVIRTVLNYFLERDLEAFEAEPPAGVEAPP